jgi:single-stranded-DNA-specific exonuclease
MQKYKIRENVPEDIRKSLVGLSEMTQHLLYHRQIHDLQNAEIFLNPDYTSGIYDPYLLKDMDKAVSRFLKAIFENETIAIFSDYDADGIPGAVVLSDFFKKIGYQNFIVYIPHRDDEGYGMNTKALDFLKEQNVSLVITIDCGISDHQKVSYANSLQMDVIVTDHHLPHDLLPEAFAIINPKQKDCLYPEKMLCGCAVIFKFICAVISNNDFKNKYNIPAGWEKWLLDMVGLATLSDMVPLLGENRIFAFYGLKVLQKTSRFGLLKLFSLLKIDKNNLTEDDIGFLITPRINAASRIGNPKDAFVTLSEKDEVLATSGAIHLNKINDERKGLVSSMTKEIKKIIDQRSDVVGNVLVLGNPKWKPSLLGLVANSFSEEHRKPVFIWGRENGDGILKGSCRSYGGVSVVELMKKCQDLLNDFGGHKQAGGFSIDQKKIHLLEESLNKAFDDIYSDGFIEEEVYIDKKISIDDVSWNLWKLIEKFAPFGIDNPKPIFMLENIDIFEVKHFGKEKNHLEISFKNSSGNLVKAIAFFKTKESFGLDLEVGNKINMIFNLEKSNFKNYPELRLRVVDIF